MIALKIFTNTARASPRALEEACARKGLREMTGNSSALFGFGGGGEERVDPAEEWTSSSMGSELWFGY